MKPTSIDRRAFVSTTARAGVCLCGLCLGSSVLSLADDDPGAGTEDAIDLAGRCFCGYVCPDDCPFLQGTLQDDVELKRKAWQLWKIEERFGTPFDPEQAICFGCKALDKPSGVVLANCSVRACAIEKHRESCIDCDELATCDKDLWTRFPEFKKQVIELQKRYRQQA